MEPAGQVTEAHFTLLHAPPPPPPMLEPALLEPALLEFAPLAPTLTEPAWDTVEPPPTAPGAPAPPPVSSSTSRMV